MPAPKALTPDQAKRTIAARFAGRIGKVGLADRLRQLYTRFGLRSKRVFLVWTVSSGARRGAGTEKIVARVELLPTPKVSDLTAKALNPYSAGTLPVGTVRLQHVSAALSADVLTGRRIPQQVGNNSVGYQITGPVPHQEERGYAPPLPEDVMFFYEIVEDGRHESEPARARYRLAASPNLNEGGVYWDVLLEASSEDLARSGLSEIGVDPDQERQVLDADFEEVE